MKLRTSWGLPICEKHVPKFNAPCCMHLPLTLDRLTLFTRDNMPTIFFMEYKIKTKWKKYSLESGIKQPQLSAPRSIESWFFCHYELWSAWLTLYSRPNDLPILQCCRLLFVRSPKSVGAGREQHQLRFASSASCSTNQLWLLYRNLIRLSNQLSVRCDLQLAFAWS